MSTPPIVEIPHVESEMDLDSILFEDLRTVRAQSPRATIGEAGTFWDPQSKMSEEMMKNNSLALIGREAVYCMRKEGESSWNWYCGLLSMVGNMGRVTLSNSTSLLRGVYRHTGPDETFDFPHAGFEYAHVISKDVYWDEWSKRLVLENEQKMLGMCQKVTNLESQVASLLSPQMHGAQPQPQMHGVQPQPQMHGAQPQPQIQQESGMMQQMMALLSQNQQLCQMQLQHSSELLKKKSADVCQLSPENIECLDFDLATDATNVLQWRDILAQGGSERLLDKLENKYWSVHRGKLATRELRELKAAFEIVRDNVRVASTRSADWITSKPLVRSMNKSLESLIMKWEYTTKRISSDDIERRVKSGMLFEKAVRMAEVDAEKKHKIEMSGKGYKGSWNPRNFEYRGKGFSGNVGGAGKGHK